MMSMKPVPFAVRPASSLKHDRAGEHLLEADDDNDGV